MTILEKIEKQYVNLTKKEKQIALYILQHPNEIKTSTITDLAVKIGTSPALITHFCKKIDNISFMDLKLEISSVREQENIVKSNLVADHISEFYYHVIERTKRDLTVELVDSVLEKIKEKGVNIAYLTLHVGLGTFRPVAVENIEEHDMHSEYYTLDEDTARIINKTKEDGGRVFSVGTTSTRTLETIARDNNGKIVAASGWTNIFIYPGFEFKCVDGLITNFHLPKSSLIMLVSAFYDREKVIELYNIAVENKYRFFSFGDAMIII